MTIEPTPAATPAVIPGNAPQPLAGTTTPTNAQAAMSQQDYDRIIAELRKENAGHRTKLNKFEADEKAKADAQLSEVEKTKRAHADMEVRYQQAQKLLVESEVRYASKDKGIINPDLIAPAIMSKLEYGDDGKPTNLEKVLDDLIKANPFIVAATNAQPASPAQTNTPALPAMNPGRSSIPSPTGNIPGVRRRLSEFL